MSDSGNADAHGGRKAAMSFILIAVLIDMVSIGATKYQKINGMSLVNQRFVNKSLL